MSAEAQRRLILHMLVSLDRFVARRDRVIDWLTDERSGVDHGGRRHHANLELLGQTGLIVLGRGAYRLTVHPVAARRRDLAHARPARTAPFEPISSTAYADGCVVQVLVPA
jgi:hypothetical protein